MIIKNIKVKKVFTNHWEMEGFLIEAEDHEDPLNIEIISLGKHWFAKVQMTNQKLIKNVKYVIDKKMGLKIENTIEHSLKDKTIDLEGGTIK